MKPAAHGVSAIFVVQQQLLRQQEPKLQMGFYCCCCCCFSTSFFAIQFINMENGFGNWSVKCALLIRRTGRTASHANGLLSDLGHFIMPFTCLHTHTCAECVLHKLHITHTPRSWFFRKFMQAKSKIRWQINYAQNSWPLCWVRSVNWLQTRCHKKQRTRLLLATQLPPAAASSTSTSATVPAPAPASAASWTSTLATGRQKATSLRSRARKTYFRIHQQAKVVPDSFVSPDFTSSYCCQCCLPRPPLPPCNPLCPPAVPVDCLARFLLPTLQRN